MQVILLHCNSHKFAILPDHFQLINLCSNVGITKTVAKGHYFTTFEDAELNKFEGLMSRVYFYFENNAASKVKGWIRGNTKIGPALEVSASLHQGRYGIEIMIELLLGDEICCWVMVVNGIST